MGDDSSHSIFDAIRDGLKKLHENLSEKNIEQNHLDLDNQDLLQSMGLHKKLLDHEVKTINSELEKLVKNKESVDYLINLIEKRNQISKKISNINQQLNQIDRHHQNGA